MKSKNIYIRNLNKNDCSEILSKVATSKKLYGPWVSPPSSELEFKAAIKRASLFNQENFAICFKENDDIVGVININEIVRGRLQSGYLRYYAFLITPKKGI